MSNPFVRWCCSPHFFFFFFLLFIKFSLAPMLDACKSLIEGISFQFDGVMRKLLTQHTATPVERSNQISFDEKPIFFLLTTYCVTCFMPLKSWCRIYSSYVAHSPNCESFFCFIKFALRLRLVSEIYANSFTLRSELSPVYMFHLQKVLKATISVHRQWPHIEQRLSFEREVGEMETNPRSEVEKINKRRYPKRSGQGRARGEYWKTNLSFYCCSWRILRRRFQGVFFSFSFFLFVSVFIWQQFNNFEERGWEIVIIVSERRRKLIDEKRLSLPSDEVDYVTIACRVTPSSQRSPIKKYFPPQCTRLFLPKGQKRRRTKGRKRTKELTTRTTERNPNWKIYLETFKLCINWD